MIWADRCNGICLAPLPPLGWVLWSVLALQQRRLIPRGLPLWPLPLVAGGLISYWLLRLSTNSTDNRLARMEKGN